MTFAKESTTTLWNYYKDLEEMTSKVVVNARASWFDSSREGVRSLLEQGSLLRREEDAGSESAGGGGGNSDSDRSSDSESDSDSAAKEARASYEDTDK